MFLGVDYSTNTDEKLLLQYYVNNRYSVVICMSMRSSDLLREISETRSGPSPKVKSS